jgi:type II secretory pathway component PulM
MATTLQPTLRGRVGQWWQLRSRSERVLLSLGGAFVLAAAAWFALWQPIQRDIERLTRELATQRTALAEAQRRAEDIATLSRNAGAPPAARDVRADLDAALARQGIKATAIERVDNDRLRVTLDALGFDTLPALLDTLQRDAKLRAVDLLATARLEPGQVRVEITLAP